VIASTSRPSRLPRSSRARRVSRVRRLGRLARLSRRHVPLVVAAAAMAVALAGGSALALSGVIHKESRRAPAGGTPVPVQVAGQPDSYGRPNGGSAGEPGRSGLGPAASISPTISPTTSTEPAKGQPAPKRFTLVAPGGTLPSGAQCAQWVRAAPSAETKPANTGANQQTGHRIDPAKYSTTDARANQRIAPRVDGQFTGSTRDILRWAACKWGFDEDFVYAQAAVESWWRQGTFGDWTTDASRCAPGHGPGADGRPGECPESFGIVQTRYPYMTYGWPGIGRSTAMGADLGYANLRACFEGYEGWLNGVEKGRQYGPGDVWGCAGRYMSGRWYTAAGNDYVTKVRTYLGQRIWETTDFQRS
jgi:hypothetical protein